MSYIKGVCGNSNRNIDPYSLAPSVFHGTNGFTYSAGNPIGRSSEIYAICPTLRRNINVSSEAPEAW
jgi:hypothetical protein